MSAVPGQWPGSPESLRRHSADVETWRLVVAEAQVVAAEAVDRDGVTVVPVVVFDRLRRALGVDSDGAA